MSLRLSVALAGFAGLAAFAQVQQDALDCESIRNYDDPRCAAETRSSGQMSREGSAYPRLPVIRDQAASPGAMDRADRDRSREDPTAGPLTPYVPPEEPTEFQRFVQQSTGRLLPIFGHDLFRQPPSTFAPADRVPVTPEYTVGPGDQLLIRGWGQIDLNVTPVVDRSGGVYIPQVGQLNVAGMRFAQVQDYLKAAIGKVFRNFDLSVNMGQLRSIQVYVVGHARRPGAYTISSLSTLVNAIFVSGGPDAHGSMRHILLKRVGDTVAEFDLYDLLLSGDKSKDERLLPGDVIYIPQVGPQVAVTGSVNTGAVYELRDGSSLQEALQLAGGLTPVAASRKALIERVDGTARRVIEAPLEDAVSMKLRTGDIVNILSIVPRFEEAVTLRGNVADPIRMPWRPGMRIRDLIPDRSALLTRDYWRSRNRLRPDPQPRERNANENLSVEELADNLAPQYRTPQQTPVDERPRTTIAATYQANSRRLFEAPRTGAGVAAPGSIAATKAEEASAGNKVERNTLEVNWSYAVIERQDPKDLKTSLIPFNLGKAIIDGDERENIPLQAGDIVTIFSTADLRVPQAEQTRYVRLEGEFLAAGVYSVRLGETLRALVARAGGLTPQAYPFASEFLRESSRLEQQQRLDDFVNSLDRQVESSASNIRGSVISPEEAAAAVSQVNSQRELITKLRQVKATGRIVLDLDRRLPAAEALPDLQLEDGDVFIVPNRPAMVNVVGSVYNGTSFLYAPEKRLGDYLRSAGGATRTGDPHHTFLIRADGSVVGKSWAAGVFSQSFEGLRLNPGDTIVVPEEINRTTFLKQLKDWSQVFAQFGLGAAAINVLR
jgi:protein involved in polysaccharide export with SLBB domain